jgi:hypothetical protein
MAITGVGNNTANCVFASPNGSSGLLNCRALVAADLPAGTTPVTSVFARTGAVVATSGDYAVAQVTGAAPLASPTFTGTVTLPAAETIPATGTTISPATGTTTTVAATGQLNLSDGGLLQLQSSSASTNACGNTTFCTFLGDGSNTASDFMQLSNGFVEIANNGGIGTHTLMKFGVTSGCPYELSGAGVVNMAIDPAACPDMPTPIQTASGAVLVSNNGNAWLQVINTQIGLQGPMQFNGSTSGNVQIGCNPNTTCGSFQIGGSGGLTLTAGPIAQVAAVSTTGNFGVPVVTGQTNFTGRTTALGTTTVVTAPASNSTYRVAAFASCSTSVSGAQATITITYHDTSNTVQTVTGTGALCTTLGAASVQSVSLPLIRVKASTVITWAIAITGSPNFDAAILVEQISTS